MLFNFIRQNVGDILKMLNYFNFYQHDFYFLKIELKLQHSARLFGYQPFGLAINIKV